MFGRRTDMRKNPLTMRTHRSPYRTLIKVSLVGSGLWTRPIVSIFFFYKFSAILLIRIKDSMLSDDIHLCTVSGIHAVTHRSTSATISHLHELSSNGFITQEETNISPLTDPDVSGAGWQGSFLDNDVPHR